MCEGRKGVKHSCDVNQLWGVHSRIGPERTGQHLWNGVWPYNSIKYTRRTINRIEIWAPKLSSHIARTLHLEYDPLLEPYAYIKTYHVVLALSEHVQAVVAKCHVYYILD
jgi:hypothetical protein